MARHFQVVCCEGGDGGSDLGAEASVHCWLKMGLC